MSSMEETLSWQEVGEVEELKKRKCRRLYTASGKDLALFYLKKEDEMTAKFYATSAICPHAGGPIDQADIEDYGKNVHVICPTHMFAFDLETGVSAYGLKLPTYAVEEREGKVYVHAPEPLSVKYIKPTN